MKSKKQTVFVSLLLLVVFGGIVLVFGLLRQNESSVPQPPPVSAGTSSGGTVAVLATGTASQPQPVQEQPQVQSSATETQPDEASEEPIDTPYQIVLPAGWEKVDSATQPEPCNGEGEAKVDTYRNGEETFIVYENTHPDGCSRTSLADVALDYDFNDDGSQITVDTSSIVQCSKDDNPACPKGDGRVSVYIGNQSAEDPSKLRENPKNGKTYFFSITDTSVDPSLEQQVSELAGLAQLIRF